MHLVKKSIALVLSIFILVILFSFVGLSTYQYISQSKIQRYYEDSLQSLYGLEVARIALLWEEAHAPIPNSWDTDEADVTYNSVNRLEGSEINDTDGFYRVNGYNFRAKAINDGQQIVMYVHAFEGDEVNPVGSRYLEYIHAPSPMYRFAMFSNNDLVFSGDAVFDVNGGRIHSNKNIQFKPTGYGLRFNDLSEMTASGTIYYGQHLTYPAPSVVDGLDGVDDNMAPAPYTSSNPGYYATTTGDMITPGPFRDWGQSDGAWNLGWDGYGRWLGDSSYWGTYNKTPLMWRGEDTYFYGRQYGGSGHYTNEMFSKYLTFDGNYSSSSTDVTVYRPSYDYNNDTLNFYQSTNGYYYRGDVYFKPSADKEGAKNEDWFGIPGALDEEYAWENKYTSDSGDQSPVAFYVTESCKEGLAGCKVSKGPDDSIDEGWRYLKKDKDGNVCGDDECYSAAESNYVAAQDHKTGGQVYDSDLAVQCAQDYCSAEMAVYSNCMDACEQAGQQSGIFCLLGDCYDEYLAYRTCYNDNNCQSQAYRDENYFDSISQDSDDKKEDIFGQYLYGVDATDLDHELRKIRAFNSEKQPSGFSEYLSYLAEKGIEGVMQSGVEKKEPYLGKIFDDTEGDSPYKERARDNGIYIEDDGTILFKGQDVTSTLNSADVAEKVTFYNWKTNSEITVVDINVEKAKELGYNPANGVIYSKYPVRLTNAQNLPGTNAGNKKAVFTVIGEESVYLKGDYNSQDWKISNIATKKKVYTLSDEFNDPKEAPDWAIYPEYPYVYVKVDRVGDEVVKYYKEEGDPASKNGVWVNGRSAKSKYEDEYVYYYGMTPGQRKWAQELYEKKQSEYVASGINPPNRVCEDGSESCSYEYNSLFLTPYDDGKGDDTLENWYYIDDDGDETQATKVMNGAFLDFYDPNDSEYNDEYKASLGYGEYATGGYGCDLRREGQTDYLSKRYSWYIRYYGAGIKGHGDPKVLQSYDARFPQASPGSSAGVLGFTGGNSWRLISEDYFNDHT